MHKKWNLKFFFSQIRKLDLDMIWDHDRYVKASNGSTLQDSNNGFTIFGDLGRKASNISAGAQIRCKKRFWRFFEKYRKSMSKDSKYCSEIIRNRNSTSEVCLGCLLKVYFEKNEFFLKDFLLKESSLKIGLKNADKIWIKLFHFLRFALHMNSLEVWFGCTLSIQNDLRAMFWI